jgi:RNA polymerase-associated protein CTR9
MDDDTLAVPSRTVDIELTGNEIITIDLDNLDPQPDDVLELLTDGKCKVQVWAHLGSEYLRNGFLDAAELLGGKAIECKWRFIVLNYWVWTGAHAYFEWRSG